MRKRQSISIARRITNAGRWDAGASPCQPPCRALSPLPSCCRFAVRKGLCSPGRCAGASFPFANTGCVSYLRLRDQSVFFNSLCNADRGCFERIRNGCCNEDPRGRQTFVPRWSQSLPSPRKRFSRPKPPGQPNSAQNRLAYAVLTNLATVN